MEIIPENFYAVERGAGQKQYILILNSAYGKKNQFIDKKFLPGGESVGSHGSYESNISSGV